MIAAYLGCCLIFLYLALIPKEGKHLWFNILFLALTGFYLLEYSYLAFDIWWLKNLKYFIGLVQLTSFFLCIRNQGNYSNRLIIGILLSILALMLLSLVIGFLSDLQGDYRQIQVEESANFTRAISLVILGISQILLLLYAFLTMINQEGKNSRKAASLFIWACITLVAFTHNSLVDFQVVSTSPSMYIMIVSGILYWKFFLKTPIQADQ